MDIIIDAIRLLRAGAPTLSASLLSHIQFIVTVQTSGGSDPARLFSASNSALPGAVFLCRSALVNRLAAAEGIAHEATHQRLYELTWSRTIYANDYDPFRSPRVVPPWYAAESGGGLPWAADRVLAALHVYAHLAILWHDLLADTRHLASSEIPMVESRMRRALHKGGLLADLAHGVMASSFGPDGRELIDMLDATLASAAAIYHQR
jgi:HEXXH motif-containing protein